MFGFLKDGIANIFSKYFSKNKITQEDFDAAIDDIKDHLLNSDVAIEVVDALVKNIRDKVVGLKLTSNAKDIFIKAFYDEIVRTLSSENNTLNLVDNKTNMILVFGNQGHGKTTTIGKLAQAIKEDNLHDIALTMKKDKQKKNYRILLASLDIYRPAAVKQLSILASKVGVDCLDHDLIDDTSINGLIAAIHAKKNDYDIVIVDTAGRASHDNIMMQELSLVAASFDFTEQLIVVDSMLGQESVRIAKEFNTNANINISGIIMTRMDSNSYGGAVLSVKYIINKPIKFIGTGESLDDLDVFSPTRIAGRILNQGDILSLAHKVEKNVKKQDIEDMMTAMREGRLNLHHFKMQLQQILNPGMMDSLLSSLPGAGNLPGMSEEKSRKQLSILQSMTHEELSDHLILNPSRKHRIAKGSGNRVLEVDMTVQQFLKIKRNMDKMHNLFGNMGDEQKGSMMEMLKSKMGGSAPSGMMDSLMDMFNKKK